MNKSCKNCEFREGDVPVHYYCTKWNRFCSQAVNDYYLMCGRNLKGWTPRKIRMPHPLLQPVIAVWVILIMFFLIHAIQKIHHMMTAP